MKGKEVSVKKILEDFFFISRKHELQNPGLVKQSQRAILKELFKGTNKKNM